jgi:hypothetical protein
MELILLKWALVPVAYVLLGVRLVWDTRNLAQSLNARTPHTVYPAILLLMVDVLALVMLLRLTVLEQIT